MLSSHDCLPALLTLRVSGRQLNIRRGWGRRGIHDRTVNYDVRRTRRRRVRVRRIHAVVDPQRLGGSRERR